tara:strand:- start:418 stop:750 length:333 start_codon:yes stop_codon:yes gene_type:complete
MNYVSEPIMIPKKFPELNSDNHNLSCFNNFSYKTPEYSTPPIKKDKFFENNIEKSLYSNNRNDPNNPYEPSPTDVSLFQKIYMDLYANISLAENWTNRLKHTTSISDSKN